MYSKAGGAILTHTTPDASKKLAYLDGLRGIAALVVVLTHYKLMLYPRFLDPRFQEQGAIAHLPYEAIIEKLPLMIFFTGGSLSVYLFFIHSGFVLSYKYVQTGNPRFLVSMAIRRVLRLGIPVAVAVFFAYGIMQLSLMHNAMLAPISGSQWWLGTFYQFSPSLRSATTDAFTGVLFGNEARYNAAFWTMPIELTCSYLLFVLLPFLMRLRTRVLACLLVLIWLVTPLLPLTPPGSQYVNYRFIVYFFAGFVYCAVFVRTDLFHRRLPALLDRVPGMRLVFMLLAVAPWLYMSVIQQGLTLLFDRHVAPMDTSHPFVMHLIAWATIGTQGQLGWLESGSALMLVALVLTSPFIQRLFSRPIFQHLGRLSFPVYLVHLPILCSFSSWLFLMLYRRGVPYNGAALLTYSVSLPVVYTVGAFMARFIDRFAINAGKETINKYLFRRSPTRSSRPVPVSPMQEPSATE